MFNIVLYQPEIPPNTGNIIHLCANTGCDLHLIHPLGFRLDEKSVSRAGMDYQEMVPIEQYKDLEAFYSRAQTQRVFAISTKGKTCYSKPQFQYKDTLLFGPETRGLPTHILAEFKPEQILNIPMADHSRSLNLANAVSVVIYEAWRKNNFAQIPY